MHDTTTESILHIRFDTMKALEYHITLNLDNEVWVGTWSKIPSAIDSEQSIIDAIEYSYESDLNGKLKSLDQ